MLIKKGNNCFKAHKDALSGNETLYVPSNVFKRLEKNRNLRKGMNIRLAKTNIREQIGGSLLTSILSLGLPIAKTLGLSALIGGLASEGASQIVKRISGNGMQSGGFLVPQNKINQLIAYKHLLTTKQKQDLLNALQTGGSVQIRPSKTQSDGFLGTLLASIGVPLAIEAIKKISGKGAPRMGKSTSLPQSGSKKEGTGAPRIGSYKPPPPFFGNWPGDTIGMGTKKKKAPRKSKKGKGLLLGANSPLKNVPLLNILF